MGVRGFALAVAHGFGRSAPSLRFGRTRPRKTSYTRRWHKFTSINQQRRGGRRTGRFDGEGGRGRSAGRREVISGQSSVSEKLAGSWPQMIAWPRKWIGPHQSTFGDTVHVTWEVLMSRAVACAQSGRRRTLRAKNYCWRLVSFPDLHVNYCTIFERETFCAVVPPGLELCVEFWW